MLVAVDCAVSVHVPAPMTDTESPLTVHTVVVDDEMEMVPSLVVLTAAVKLEGKVAELGKLVIVGVLGATGPTGAGAGTTVMDDAMLSAT